VTGVQTCALPIWYGPVGGTSISAPVVSGIIGLMLTYRPTASIDELENALFSSVDPITGVTQSGSAAVVKYGRVNAYGALVVLGAVIDSQSPAPSPSPTVTPSPTGTGPSPTPLPSQSPPVSPSVETTTFSGSVNRKNPARSFVVTVGSGPANARLAFSKCQAMTLGLSAADGTTVATVSGPSVVVLDDLLGQGTYSYTVSATAQCSFSLTVTSTV